MTREAKMLRVVQNMHRFFLETEPAAKNMSASWPETAVDLLTDSETWAVREREECTRIIAQTTEKMSALEKTRDWLVKIGDYPMVLLKEKLQINRELDAQRKLQTDAVTTLQKEPDKASLVLDGLLKETTRKEVIGHEAAEAIPQFVKHLESYLLLYDLCNDLLEACAPMLGDDPAKTILLYSEILAKKGTNDVGKDTGCEIQKGPSLIANKLAPVRVVKIEAKK